MPSANANLHVAAFAEEDRQSIKLLTFMRLAFPIMMANVYIGLRYF